VSQGASVGASGVVWDGSQTIRLQRLTLTHFRNHASLDLTLDLRPVVICGPNGLGKTNVLEAISLLTPGRGLRQARYGDMVGQNGDGSFSIFARIHGPRGEVGVGTGVLPDAPERRVVRMDGTGQSRASALGHHMRALWLTPDMDRLFVDPAAVRRRFLDRLALALDPDHAEHGAVYERAMRQRNRLLREAKANGQTPDPAWMDGLDRQMAQAGTALAAGRRATLARLANYIAASPDGPFPRPVLALDGLVEGWLDQSPAPEVEARYVAQLARGRARDFEAGRCLEGPHTSDLAVRHQAKDQPASLCSTGEQKALLIAIILAHARGLTADGMGPVLLLDEVAAHLDAIRRQALFDAILSLGLQAWMTGTDRVLFEALGDCALYPQLKPAMINH